MDKTAIRHAATVVVVRNICTTPRILMGQRAAKAAFMPNKFVFPGGAVDPHDAAVPFSQPLNDTTLAQLAQDSDMPGQTLAAAAIRELWEETGLVLGARADWPDAPIDWQSFAATGHLPTAQDLHFIFRAITPPGRTRRFDARFFLIDAAAITSDLDNFSNASDELSDLQWIPLADVRTFNLPFITEVVLAEVAKMAKISSPESVPFFRNDDEESLFLRLGGRRL